MDAIELYDIVAEDPRLQEILRRFVQAERAGRKGEYFLGLEWFEVQANARYLNSLVDRWLVRVSFKSNKTTCYVLEDLELTDRVLRKLSGESVDLDLSEPEERLPEDFMATLIGYDDLGVRRRQFPERHGARAGLSLSHRTHGAIYQR